MSERAFSVSSLHVSTQIPPLLIFSMVPRLCFVGICVHVLQVRDVSMLVERQADAQGLKDQHLVSFLFSKRRLSQDSSLHRTPSEFVGQRCGAANPRAIFAHLRQ